MEREYGPEEVGGVKRLLILLMLWSDSGQITDERAAHPISMCLGNQAAEGKYSLLGKVSRNSTFVARVPIIVMFIDCLLVLVL